MSVCDCFCGWTILALYFFLSRGASDGNGDFFQILYLCLFRTRALDGFCVKSVSLTIRERRLERGMIWISCSLLLLHVHLHICANVACGDPVAFRLRLLW